MLNEGPTVLSSCCLILVVVQHPYFVSPPGEESRGVYHAAALHLVPLGKLTELLALTDNTLSSSVFPCIVFIYYRLSEAITEAFLLSCTQNCLVFRIEKHTANYMYIIRIFFQETWCKLQIFQLNR